MHFRQTYPLIVQHRKALISLTVLFYCLFLLSFCLTLLHPEFQRYQQPEIDQAYRQPGLLKMAADAYGAKQTATAAALTFLVNSGVALGTTTLPSLIVPFAGLLAVFHRAVLWGVMFAPVGPHPATLIPHSLTLLIEGQAYVLAALAAYVQGMMFLFPKRYGIKSHGAGFIAGCVASYKIYLLILLTLFIAAVYESVEVIYLMPIFLNP
ncbi:hypothetical protein [Pseudomonas pergaminensis]